MKKDIYRGHLFLLVLILASLGSGFLEPYISSSAYELVHQFIFLALPSFIYVLIRKKNFARTFRLGPVSPRDMVLLVLTAIIMQPAVYMLALIAQIIFGNQLDFLFSDLMDASVAYLLFTVAITPAICEELVMRGVVMDAYRGKSLYTVIVMNGLLFGLFHMNANQFIYTFFIGMVLSLSVHYTNSIFAGMIIHFVNNALSILTIKFPDSLYAKLEYSLFSISSLSDVIRVAVLGVLSFVLTFRTVNFMGRMNRNRFGHEAVLKNYEPIVNWPLAVIGIFFLVMSVFLTIVVSGA